jgi:hypothetical protein
MLALSLVTLFAVDATLIAVRDTDTSCPTSREVTRAIEARLPGLLVPLEQSALAQALVLTLSSDPATGVQGFTLVDQKDQLRLRRALPPPASAGPAECPALADTVALMVERYLQELGYRAEPPPVPVGERWDLFGGATWRSGADGLSAYELRLGAARALGARGRFLLALVAGVEGASRQEWPGVTGRLRLFPVELRLLARLPVGSFRLETGPFAGIQLLALDSWSNEEAKSELHAIPVAGWGAGLRIPLGRRAFLRVLAGVGVAVLRYDFFLDDVSQTVAFGTERVWGKMGVEAGFSFW